jgi:hypothetical protein
VQSASLDSSGVAAQVVANWHRQQGRGPVDRRRRTWGAATGLEDIPLLPPLFTNVEDRFGKDIILLICMRLLGRQGMRPLGINMDDLESSFHLVTSAMVVGMPGRVRERFVYDGRALAADDAQFVREGGVVIDPGHFRVYGFYLGQDALHVYFRLMEAIEWYSSDAAWAMRCLRKLLSSWNPGRSDETQPEHVKAEDYVSQRGLDWLSVDASAQAGSVASVLLSYFHGSDLAFNAYEVLRLGAVSAWMHPDTGVVLPRCAKAVVMDDVARLTALRGQPRSRVSAIVFGLVYMGELTETSIVQDMLELAQLLAASCFGKMVGGSNGLWGKAQMDYLRHVRKRPRGPKQEVSVAVAKNVPAGGPAFDKAVQLQCRTVTVNGLLAAYRGKDWALRQGFRVSLGTVGAERFWRNMQRMARNKGRSCADVITINLLVLVRWLKEIQTRSLQRTAGCNSMMDAAGLSWLSAASERFADVVLRGPAADAPLSEFDVALALGSEEDSIGYLYAAYQRGEL